MSSSLEMDDARLHAYEPLPGADAVPGIVNSRSGSGGAAAAWAATDTDRTTSSRDKTNRWTAFAMRASTRAVQLTP
jgi:hypothetical protein